MRDALTLDWADFELGAYSLPAKSRFMQALQAEQQPVTQPNASPDDPADTEYTEVSGHDVGVKSLFPVKRKG